MSITLVHKRITQPFLTGLPVVFQERINVPDGSQPLLKPAKYIIYKPPNPHVMDPEGCRPETKEWKQASLSMGPTLATETGPRRGDHVSCSNMAIPFVDLDRIHRPLRADIDRAIAEVIDSGQFIGGPVLAAFEQELAAYLGATHVVGVSSGTDALLASLMALGIGPGDDVVTTPFSFFATASVISRVGAKPVFADIDPDTFNVDPDRVRSAIGPHTRAFVPVHLYGRPAEIPPLDIAIIEDAAQSIGASRLRGTVGCLSFFPTKNLGAFGDGGAVYTDDADLAEKLKVVRSQGSKPKYHHAMIGGNFRLDPLQAAILRVKLGHLDSWSQTRRQNAARYRRLFAEAQLPAELVVPTDAEGHVYNQFVIRAPRRDSLAIALKEQGIATVVYYPIPFHRQKAYSGLGYRDGEFPEAERACREVLALPIYPGLTEAQQTMVVGAIARFYK